MVILQLHNTVNIYRHYAVIFHLEIAKNFPVIIKVPVQKHV